MATALHTGEMRKTLGEPTEDFVASTVLEVRRHPLIAVGVAATAGLVTGCAFGAAAAWFRRRRD